MLKLAQSAELADTGLNTMLLMMGLSVGLLSLFFIIFALLNYKKIVNKLCNEEQ